jgi:hypothetical protein
MTDDAVDRPSSVLSPSRREARGQQAVPTAPDGAAVPSRLLRSEKLLLAATGIGLLHHLDHVLRFDHSGWPFRADVTPFTFSLLVYPIVLLIFTLRSRPWWRAGLLALVFLAVQTAHVLIESPADQYGTWAHGASSDPAVLGAPNLLGIASPALGLVAAALSLLLSVALLATLADFVADAVHHGQRHRAVGP